MGMEYVRTHTHKRKDWRGNVVGRHGSKEEIERDCQNDVIQMSCSSSKYKYEPNSLDVSYMKEEDKENPHVKRYD